MESGFQPRLPWADWQFVNPTSHETMLDIKPRRPIAGPEIRDGLRVSYRATSAGRRSTVVERFAERIARQKLQAFGHSFRQLALKAVKIGHIARVALRDRAYILERLD